MDQNSSSPRIAASGQRWIARNSAGYEAPAALATDVVVFTVRERRLLVLGVAADGDAWALPGGFVGPHESADDSSRRKLMEKTGLGADLYLEQLATFAAPDRDPRGWIPTVAYVALVPPATKPTDAGARWLPAAQPPRLAYDHAVILRTAIDRVQGKLWWSNVAVGILPGEFTLAQAREVYEAIAGAGYDASTFARDLRATGLIEPTGSRREATGGRPATLYRFREHSPAWGHGRRKRVH